MEQQYNFGHWGPTSEEILRSQFPLHRACRDGDLDSLSLLLVEAQHGIYEEDSFYGWTPAHWAAYFGKLSCLMRLLDTRLDCDVSTIQLNQTAMHIAAFAGRSHCLKWLLHCGAKLDRQLACLRKLMTTTRVGVNCNVRTSRFIQTPAHLAAFGGHPQCLLWLASANADINLQDYLGETAVHKAARTGSMECLSLLVSHGARLYIHSNTGQSPCQLAATSGHQEATRFLESAAQSQESQSRGVYASQPDPHAVTTPSRHDVTTKVHPCVIAQGLNAGRLPAAGPQGDVAPQHMATEECPMEETDTPSSLSHVGGGGDSSSSTSSSVTDITLHHGVSANIVSIGGRKRCREEADEVDHKRRRSDLSLGGKNTRANGSCEGMAWTGVSQEAVTMDEPKRLSDELDYSVGYDYNGIPQDENDDPNNPVHQTQMLEYPVVNQSWNGVSAMSAGTSPFSSILAPMATTTTTTTSSTCCPPVFKATQPPNTFSSMGKALPSVHQLSATQPTNGLINGFSPSSSSSSANNHNGFGSTPAYNAIHNHHQRHHSEHVFSLGRTLAAQQSPSSIPDSTAGLPQQLISLNGSLLNGNPLNNTPQAGLRNASSSEMMLSSSVQEHEQCILSQRGYDSLLHDNLVPCSME